jgi:hypothetical protein
VSRWLDLLVPPRSPETALLHGGNPATGRTPISHPRLPVAGLLHLVGLGLAGLVLWAAIHGVSAATGMATTSPVYTVAEVRANLARHPAAWIGRTAWVRGLACWMGLGLAPHARCLYDRPTLRDADGTAVLPLGGGAPDPLLASLRRLPPAGQLLSLPQRPRWGALGTNHIRLLAMPATACWDAPCYAALLLDAAPAAFTLGEQR